MTGFDRVDHGRLTFGGASLGNLFHAVSDEQARATLETCWDLGIRSYDTSPHYGLGLSERRIGAFLRSKPRDEFLLSTKVGRLLEPTPERAGEPDDTWFVVPSTARRRWDYSADGIRRSLDDSLERLGLDRVDILYLHDPEQYRAEQSETGASISGALAALAGLRESGLVGAVGVGTSDVGILRSAVEHSDIDLLMVSNRYTLLDSTAASLSPLCDEHGVGMVAVGVFNSGLLATPQPRADAHFEYGPVPPAMLDRAHRIAAVCAAHGVELPAAALQFSLRDPVVRSVAVGSADPDEMRENVERMAVEIPDALWSDLTDQAG
ncbi:D-threo-aldose 1-dehydrogenase [Mycetocola sp. CAN_C7]|uniref:aldo/keto reductase n=1 Tax=Mycetocola sp. CAN_C7 TaxID=2787724 RepID=UPI0018CA5D9F